MVQQMEFYSESSKAALMVVSSDTSVVDTTVSMMESLTEKKTAV